MPDSIAGSRIALAAVAVLATSCEGKRNLGGDCEKRADCVGELACVDGQCEVDQAMHEKMAKHSGAEIASERATPAPTASGAVRVRTAAAKGYSFAMCGSDERLVGGWCSPSMEHGSQLVKGQTEYDTIGAQMTCESSNQQVTATALCQKLAPEFAAPARRPPP